MIFLVFVLAFISSLLVWKSRKLHELIDKWNQTSKLKAVVIGIIVFIIVFTIMSLLQHYALHTHIDLAMLDQIIWNTWNGDIAYTSIKQEVFFREHFVPIIFILSPLTKIFSGSYIWLIIQVIVMAVPAILIYKIANDKLKTSFGSLALSISFLFSPLNQTAILFDFHFESFVSLFIIGAIYAIHVKKTWLYWIFILLSWSIKEDIALYTIPIGILLIFKEKFKSTGILTIVFSLIWFLISIKIIIPAFSPGYYIFGNRYGWLGDNLTQIISTILFSPIKVVKHLLTVPNLDILPRLLISVAFLPLLNIWGIVLPILPLASGLLSNYAPQYQFTAHYPLAIIPFIYIGAIYGAEKLSKKYSPSIFTFVLIAGILASPAFAPAIYNFRKCRITEHQRMVFSDFFTKIPKEAAISAQVDFLPHLSRREKLYMFPEIHDAEYILIDRTWNPWPISNDEFAKKVDKIYEDKRYNIIYEEGGIMLFKKCGCMLKKSNH